MLERASHFLSTKSRAEVEAAADLYFPALGYRRRASAPGERGPIVYERGRRLASFWSATLRGCAATVTVEVLEARDGAATVHVRHAVETRGRLVIAEDGDLLEAESRAFERFVERGDPDLEGMLRAATRRRRRALLLKVALTTAFAAAIAAAFARMARWKS